MEPTLMVVGLDHRTAPLATRERFWIGENRRYEAARQLKRAEGIDEAVVLSTCCRTEFLVWASEPTLAANSLLQFLTAEHGLKLSEWEHFYRLLDEAALAHFFRVASGLDSLMLGEPQITSQVKSAWEQAKTVGAAGRSLSAVVEQALTVAEQVRRETGIEELAVSIPSATVELARQIFGSLAGRKVLLLGAGEISECAGRRLMENGASSVIVLDQAPARAQELALALGGTADTLAERWKYLLRADIVITSSGCPHVILTRDEAEHIAKERNRVALVIFDTGMPRDVDPEVRRVDGILVHDLDSLEHVFELDTAENRAAVAEAEKIVTAEVLAFRARLHAESGVPTAATLRRRLDELCRRELDCLLEERGPCSREQDHLLHAIVGQLNQKIASFVIQEIKEVSGKEEQEQMAAAVMRLFHLDSPQEALAGSVREKQNREENKPRALAINY